MTKSEIHAALAEVGLNPKYKGYTFIVDALLIIENEGGPVNLKITALYSRLSKRFKANTSNVERDIRYAITLGLGSMSKSELKKFGFVNSGSDSICTNSTFLATMYFRIKDR